MSEKKFADFQGKAPPDRVMGSEFEAVVKPQGAALRLTQGMRTHGESLGIATAPISNERRFFLSNGARSYDDLGCAEYASAEAAGPFDAVHTDAAGQNIYVNLAAKYPGNTKANEMRLYRRVGFSEFQEDGTEEVITYGFHENFLTIPEVNNERAFAVINSYLAGRNLWAGMGMVRKDGYHRSQKGSSIGNGVLDKRTKTVTLTTPGDKPLGVYYDEQMTKSYSDWPRVEIRNAESHSSKWARFMSFATMSLVLRLLEHGYDIGDDYIFKDPVRVNMDVSASPDLDKTYETESGKKISVLDQQRELALAAKELSEYVRLPEDELFAIDEWLRVLDDLEHVKCETDYHKVADRVEWAARHIVLRMKFPDENIVSTNKDIVACDVGWDRMGPKGIAQLWWKRQDVDTRVYNPELAKEYETTPPPRTRASIRGRQIKDKYSKITRIGWDYLAHLRGNTENKVPLSDPFQTAESINPK